MSCPHLLILPSWRSATHDEFHRVLDFHRAACAVCASEGDQ